MKKITILLLFTISLIACAQKTDKIVGVWNVKNDYYQAVYEIVENKGIFFGKIHYYNDGTREYKGTNEKKDYFLTDLEKKEGKYVNGKMYMPDGSYYNAIFSLKDNNRLEVLMTVDGKPYKEIWTKGKVIKNIFPK